MSIGLTGALFMGSNSLSAQRVGIEVTGRNISNVNTPNSARQRVDFKTDVAVTYGKLGQQGLGSYAAQIQSLRSALLDGQVVQQESLDSLYEVRANMTELLQEALGENLSTSESSSVEGVSSATGLQDSFNNFFDAWQQLASTPESTILRSEVLSMAENLVQDLSSSYDRVVDIKSGLFEETMTNTDTVQSLATQIADLNHEISRAEIVSGVQAHDLRDQRQELIENMASLVNITVTDNATNNTMVDIALEDGGRLLVQGIDNNGSGSTYRLDTVAVNPVTGLVEASNSFVKANNSQIAIVATKVASFTGGEDPSADIVTVTEGQIGAQRIVGSTDIGDGLLANDNTLVGRMNQLALNIRDQVNAIQNSATSWDLNGNNNAGDLFSATYAGDIQVIITDSDEIAAAQGATNPGPLDGSAANAIAQLREDPTLVVYHRETVSELGITAQQAKRNQTAQELISLQINNQREAVSGISLDEEMTNMISFQRAFEANARFIGVIDEMLQQAVQLT